MASIRDTLANLVEQYKASDVPAAYLLRGDAKGLWKDLNTPKPVDTAQDMTNLALGMVGSINPVGKTAQELAHAVAQKNAVEMLGLHPENTAMERARAMGFETAPSKKLYHAAKTDWETNVIDPTRSDLGFHVGNVDQANYRGNVFSGKLTDNGEWVNGYGEQANMIPLMKSKYSNMLNIKDEGAFRPDVVAPIFEQKKLIPKGTAEEYLHDPLGNENPSAWDEKYGQIMRDVLEKKGYHGVKYNNAHEGEGVSYAFTDPSMLRSPFAAFDPARKGENDILAGAMALPLSTDKEKRNKIIDLLKNK